MVWLVCATGTPVRTGYVGGSGGSIWMSWRTGWRRLPPQASDWSSSLMGWWRSRRDKSGWVKNTINLRCSKIFFEKIYLNCGGSIHLKIAENCWKTLSPLSLVAELIERLFLKTWVWWIKHLSYWNLNWSLLSWSCKFTQSQPPGYKHPLLSTGEEETQSEQGNF